MKEISLKLLSETVQTKRKQKNITQLQLAKSTGINRSIISKIESMEHIPSVNQLLAMSETLDFDTQSLFVDKDTDENADTSTTDNDKKSYNIAVAGTGYVGLSLAVLLAQHNKVTAVDIIPEKVEKLNNYISPIQDEYIEKYLSEAKVGTRTLNLTATTDGAAAYKDADFIIIAAPTNYDPKKNFFDCSAVESVIELILESTKSNKNKPTIVIKSTIYTGLKHKRNSLRYSHKVPDDIRMCYSNRTTCFYLLLKKRNN